MSDSSAWPLQNFFDLSAAEARSNCEWPRATVDLYERARPALLAYVYQLVGPTVEAEDFVHAAFVRLFHQQVRQTEIANIRSWLYRVVHNLAVDHVRRQNKQEWLSQQWLAVPDPRD